MPPEPVLPGTIQSIPEALHFWAMQTPDAPALIGPDHAVITYGALWATTRTLADRLVRFGIGRQERVVLLMPEGADLAATLLGTMSAAVALPLDVSMTLEELDATILAARAAAAIVGDDVTGETKARLVRHGLAVVAIHDSDIITASGCENNPTCVSYAPPQHIAFAVRTSGTTGKAKFVPSEHGGAVQDGRPIATGSASATMIGRWRWLPSRCHSGCAC